MIFHASRGRVWLNLTLYLDMCFRSKDCTVFILNVFLHQTKNCCFALLQTFFKFLLCSVHILFVCVPLSFLSIIALLWTVCSCSYLITYDIDAHHPLPIIVVPFDEVLLGGHPRVVDAQVHLTQLLKPCSDPGILWIHIHSFNP